MLSQRAQDEQPGRVHSSIKTRVLKYDCLLSALVTSAGAGGAKMSVAERIVGLG
jgi:hypothetical protein